MNNEELDIQFRFPIFRNEKWDLHKLSEIAEYTNGRAHEQDIETNGKYIVVNSKYISTDGEVVKYSNTANCLAEKNDILMVLSDVPNGRAIAKCYLVKEDNKYTVNQRICKITPKQGIESRLLYYLMNRNPYFLSFDDGVKQTNLRNDDVLNFEILLPTNPVEQQKIAACLSSLDDVIAGHEEKLTALEEHKKGLMQNLFPQEGETQPKHRFPEFENDGDWVEKKLGDVIELKGRIGYRGYTVEDIVNKGEGVITLSPSNIENNGSLNFDKLTYISWFKYEESPEIMLTEGFTVLVKTGSTYGKAAFIKDLPEKATVNPQIVVLKPLNINPYFLYLIVSNTKIQKQINETVVGGAIPTLSQDSILKFQFHLPVNNSEQQKIASVLSSVDELIVAQREKIAALKEHKKGLMQGLFPKIES